MDLSLLPRTVLLYGLIMCLNAVWVLEQPSSSLMIRHDRMVWLLERMDELRMRVPCIVSMQLCDCDMLHI